MYVRSHNWQTSMHVFLAGGIEKYRCVWWSFVGVGFFFNLTGICIFLVTIMQNTKPRIL